jgi:hypothetical protein
MGKQYSLDGSAGKVWGGKNPHSGTRVSVYHSEQAGMDSSEGAKYSTVCEDHSNIVSTASIALAKSAAHDSTSWCEDCQAAKEAKSNPNLNPGQFQ